MTLLVVNDLGEILTVNSVSKQIFWAQNETIEYDTS